MNIYWKEANLFLLSLGVAMVLTVFCLSISLGLGWGVEQSWLEIFAVATSFSCTFLCVFQSRWNFPIGILTTFLYSWLFFQWDLPGVALFNLYLVGSLTYGWFRWGPDDQTRPVTRLSGWRDIANYTGIGLAVAALLVTLSYLFNFEVSAVDFIVTVLSGVAQFLLDNKRRETWIVWAVVNVFSLYLYFTAGLYLVVLQYAFFLANTVWGWYEWGQK